MGAKLIGVWDMIWTGALVTNSVMGGPFDAEIERGNDGAVRIRRSGTTHEFSADEIRWDLLVESIAASSDALNEEQLRSVRAALVAIESNSSSQTRLEVGRALLRLDDAFPEILATDVAVLVL